MDRSISLVGERIQAILDAAAHAASEIRADAHEDAKREADRLTMRRVGEMSQLTDSLIERAESLRKQADELAREMEDAMRAVSAMPRNVTGAEPSALAPKPARETPAMRAAKMAIAGSGREEIAATLSQEYGIRDPDPILNEVLGRDG